MKKPEVEIESKEANSVATQKRKGWGRNINVAIIVTLMTILGLYHYVEVFDPIGLSAFRLELGLARYSIDRILFLIPIAYASITLGFAACLATTFTALVIMVPRAAFISAWPADAFLEIAGVMIVGCAVCFWFRAQAKVKEMEVEVIKAQTKAKTEFLQALAHELKTPLTVATVASSLLTEEINLEEPTHVKLLQLTTQGLHGLDRRISELIDFAGMEEAAPVLRLQPVDIGSVISKVTSDAALMLEIKEQEFSLELAENLPQVEADRQRLEQIVSNLVCNAIKFSPSQSNIVIKAWQAATDLMVSIMDSAPAIPKEERALIFEPYYRSQNSRTRRPPGLGLGLTICKRLIELHGSKIWVESKPGEGNIFTFSLPITKTLLSRMC